MFVRILWIELEFGLETDGLCGGEDETMDDERLDARREDGKGKEGLGLELAHRFDAIQEEFTHPKGTE